jgi:hypothetical protein
MPLKENEKADLFRHLEEKGWSWEDDAITAPGKAIWLMRSESTVLPKPLRTLK